MSPVGSSSDALAAFVDADTAQPVAITTAVVALPGGRPIFRDDVSFASWLAENSEAATPSDIALLRELLTTPSQTELLRMSGIDLEALRSLARSNRTAGAA